MVNITMTFSTVQLMQADVFSSLSSRHAPPPNLPHMAIIYTVLHFHLHLSLLVLMALLPGSCPGGTWSACCYLSLVGWSCLSSLPRQPASTTCHLSPCSDLAGIIAFKWMYILCADGIHQHMYVVGLTWTHKSANSHELMHEHTKAKAL